MPINPVLFSRQGRDTLDTYGTLLHAAFQATSWLELAQRFQDLSAFCLDQAEAERTTRVPPKEIADA